MITYSTEAKDSYIRMIEKMQTKLGDVPNDIISHTDLHWLIHTALSDLKKVVEKEHE
jgi:hypothetical protein